MRLPKIMLAHPQTICSGHASGVNQQGIPAEATVQPGLDCSRWKTSQFAVSECHSLRVPKALPLRWAWFK